MTGASPKWDDLTTRFLTGVTLGALCIGGLWLGGIWTLFLVSALAAVMVWELTGLVAPGEGQKAFALMGLTGLCQIAAVTLAPGIAWLFVPALFGALWIKNFRATFFVYSMLIQFGAFSAYIARTEAGIATVILIAAIVVVTDIAGYFAGRMLGGPKFWPRVSPKKTWSGTAAGWLAAAVVGYFLAADGYRLTIMLVAVLLAFASQAGDILESAIKRRAGAKDSSRLLPGHGGFLDRFDGMIAALSLWLLATAVGLFPGPP